MLYPFELRAHRTSNLINNILLTTSHIVKYSWQVHIVTRKHLSEAIKSYPDAANEIQAWIGIVEAVRWHNIVGSS